MPAGLLLIDKLLTQKPRIMPSTVISSVSYEPQTSTLVIKYVSGIAYHYKQVPEKVYKELKASFSKGRYLNHHIKNKYPFERVGENT